MIVKPYLGHCAVLFGRTPTPTTQPPVCGRLYSDPLHTPEHTPHSIPPQVYSHEHLQRAFERSKNMHYYHVHRGSSYDPMPYVGNALTAAGILNLPKSERVPA